MAGYIRSGYGTLFHCIPPLIIKSILPHDLSQNRLYSVASVKL